jgi:hypothetical protein
MPYMPSATHTFVTLALSLDAFKEIEGKLKAAGYEDQFLKVDGVPMIDMHNIAVVPEAIQDGKS